MQGVLPPYRRICGPHFGIDPRAPQKRTCIGGSSASFAVSLEHYDIQMGIATGISAQGLGPSAQALNARSPLNNKPADHVGDRRKGPCRRVGTAAGNSVPARRGSTKRTPKRLAFDGRYASRRSTGQRKCESQSRSRLADAPANAVLSNLRTAIAAGDLHIDPGDQLAERLRVSYQMSR
jgi:hypothetical protein